MSMPGEVKESSAEGSLKGWTKLRYSTGAERYRHDESGIELSNRQFFKLVAKWKPQGYAPITDIIAASNISGPAMIPQYTASKRVGNPPIGNPRIGRPVVDSTATPGTATPIEEEYEEEELVQTTEQPQFSNAPPPRQRILAGIRKTPGITKGMASRAAGGPHINQRTSAPSSPPPEPVAQQPANILENIEPKTHSSKPGRRIENGATSKELADGLYITLSIVTSIVAMLTKEPGLTMSEIESKNISIPAGNLIEPTDINKRFGRMIAESGDWQLLGYAIWLYIARVREPVIERFKGNKQQQQQQPPQQQTAVSNGNGVYGAMMPLKRGSSPIIRPGGQQ